MRKEEETFDDLEQTDEMEPQLFERTKLAYIKPIDLAEARAMGVLIPSEIHLPPGVKLYALHDADGTTLGVTDNWASAYNAAVQNNFVPLSVH